MQKETKPKHFLVCKIIGFIALAIGVLGIVLAFVGFGHPGGLFMFGGFLTCSGLFVGMVCLTIGFSPEITKLHTRTNKYLQEQNKENLTDISTTSAEIQAEGIKTKAKAFKEGITESDTKHCIYCGKEIPAEAKFCSNCGKEQK